MSLVNMLNRPFVISVDLKRFEVKVESLMNNNAQPEQDHNHTQGIQVYK